MQPHNFKQLIPAAPGWRAVVITDSETTTVGTEPLIAWGLDQPDRLSDGRLLSGIAGIWMDRDGLYETTEDSEWFICLLNPGQNVKDAWVQELVAERRRETERRRTCSR